MKLLSKATAFCAAMAISASLGAAFAQTDASSAPPPAIPAAVDSGIRKPDPPPAAGEPPISQDKRILGVLPNYRTTDSRIPFQPLTVKQKFTIATKDSFDWPGFILAAGFSGIYQLQNQNPSFGQGLEGYARRYATAYGDQVIGNMMTEAIIPSLFHEDPRYFRKVTGSKKGRLFYAVGRVIVTKTDAGGEHFNFSEVLGNSIAASIGNAYYPDNRGFGNTMYRAGLAIGTDAISDVLKEFWPDIKHRYFHKHAETQPAD